jgi:hypothetical protein
MSLHPIGDERRDAACARRSDGARDDIAALQDVLRLWDAYAIAALQCRDPDRHVGLELLETHAVPAAADLEVDD